MVDAKGFLRQGLGRSDLAGRAAPRRRGPGDATVPYATGRSSLPWSFRSSAAVFRSRARRRTAGPDRGTDHLWRRSRRAGRHRFRRPRRCRGHRQRARLGEVIELSRKRGEKEEQIRKAMAGWPQRLADLMDLGPPSSASATRKVVEGTLAMEIRPLSPACGAEVVGLDLCRRPTASSLICAKLGSPPMACWCCGETIDPDEHIAFSRRFGELEKFLADPAVGRDMLPGKPEIFRVSNKVVDGEPAGREDAGTYWHSDARGRRSRVVPHRSTPSRSRRSAATPCSPSTPAPMRRSRGRCRTSSPAWRHSTPWPTRRRLPTRASSPPSPRR